MRIAHIVNPVNAQPPSDLVVAQPITFESMRIARAFAAETVQVELFAVGFGEDTAVAPADFCWLPPLERSVLDVADFQQPRKLPLLGDILERLYASSDADLFIYTNVDIGLQPHFYTAVADFWRSGHDTFVINRRTIQSNYTQPSQLPLICAEVGKPHHGWDCFVFRRELYPHFVMGDVCLGAPRVGLALLANLIAAAPNFYEFKAEYLTFHLGDDRVWLDPIFQDYADHNSRELDVLLMQIEEQNGRFPRSTPPGGYLFKRRYFGFFYEAWSRRVYWQNSLSQMLNRILGNSSVEK